MSSMSNMKRTPQVPQTRLPLNMIHADPNNPNVMSAAQKKALSHIISTYGYAQAIWVRDMQDGTYEIIDGHHRYFELRQQGETEIDCRVFRVGAEDAAILRQAATKLHGKPNRPKDLEEIKRVMDKGRFDDLILNTAQDRNILEIGVAEKFGTKMPEHEPQTQQDAMNRKTAIPVKKGQLFALGPHRVYCGDATDKDSYTKLVNGKVSLLLTDPPYSTDMNKARRELNKTAHRHTTYHHIENDEQYGGFAKMLFSAFTPIKFEDKSGFYIFLMDSRLYDVAAVLHDIQYTLSQNLVWKKAQTISRKHFQLAHELILYGTATAGAWYADRKQTTVLEYKRASVNKYHLTEKPVDLLMHLIRCSTQKGEIVYDPFAGGGSLLMACEQTGRTARCMELDPQYVSTMITRWEEYTGKKHEIIDGIEVLAGPD